MSNNLPNNIRQSKRQKTLSAKAIYNCDVTSTNNSTRNTFNNSKSNKSYYCSSCKLDFSFTSVQKYIKLHALQNESCKSFLYQCGPQCEKKWFYTQSDLERHQTKSRVTSYCNEYYRNNIVPKQYGESVVNISTIIKKKSINDHYMKTIEKNIDDKEHIPIFSALRFINDGISNKIDPPKKYKTTAVTNPSILQKCHLYNQKLCGFVNENNLEILDTENISSGNNIQNHEDIFEDIQVTEFAVYEDDDQIDIADSDQSSVECDDPIGEYTDDLINITDEEDYVNCDGINNQENNQVQIHNETNLINAIQINVPQQPTIVINSSNHFLNMQKVFKREVSRLNYDTDYIDSLNLVQLLLKKKMSLSNYNNFMKWKYDNKLHSHYSMKKLIDTTSQRVYGPSLALKLKPKVNHMICPSGHRINMMTSHFDAAVYDMISCPTLTCIPNTIFEDGNEEDPFRINIKNYYGDVHQCEYYSQTIQKLNIDSKSEILVPIQLYLDETTLDQYGNISLHPVVITLLIYNRATRNLSMSWRTIAYIPNFDTMFQQCKYSVEEKVGDFHFCLRYILNGLEKLQKVDGLFWDFKFDEYPGKVYRRKLRFPLATVLGDAKGLDLLCSRFANRTKTVCVARDCNVKTLEADNPNIRCTFHKQKDLEVMNSQQLQQLSFRKINPYNAFSKIDMGANIYGINGCSPADPCHQFNKGAVERLPTIFMARLTTNMVKRLDAHVGALSTKFGSQSDRDFPNIKRFAKGISTEAKLRSDDNLGRVMTIFLVLVTKDFEREIVGKKGRKPNKTEKASIISSREYNSWIAIFEDTLILSSWVYLDKHPKEVFKGGKIVLLLTVLLNIWNYTNPLHNEKKVWVSNLLNSINYFIFGGLSECMGLCIM